MPSREYWPIFVHVLKYHKEIMALLQTNVSFCITGLRRRSGLSFSQEICQHFFPQDIWFCLHSLNKCSKSASTEGDYRAVASINCQKVFRNKDTERPIFPLQWKCTKFSPPSFGSRDPTARKKERKKDAVRLNVDSAFFHSPHLWKRACCGFEAGEENWPET